jgi:DNA-binding SARP family transcriptional activator/tetratricopeptide (TPR) repeat protein/transcriptional regulator with XRE-family HTH domain
MPQHRNDAGSSRPGDDLVRDNETLPLSPDPGEGVGVGLGTLIGDSRRAAGLTQRELADLAGVGLGTVRDVEQGRRPRSRSLARLAGALGLDIAGARDRTGAAREAASAMAAPRLSSFPLHRRAGQSAGHGGGLWLRVLGPLEGWRAGARLDLGPPRQRAVLGLLAVCPAELVRRETVIDALWGEDPPGTAASLVQAYLSRLGRVLDPGRSPRDGNGLLVSAGSSYRLQVAAGQLDLLAFWQLIERARAVRSAGDATAACGLYESALKLWHGEPLADVDLLRGHLALADLARRHAAVVMEYAEAASAAGSHEGVLPRLEALARTEPLNERIHAQLMIALASTGRQAGALKLHEDLRRRLDEQLGVQPGPELTDAHLRVLRQDVPGARPRPPGPPRPPAQAGQAASPSEVPRQLPAVVPHFAGRAAELEMLTALLEQAGSGTGPARAVVISAIGGTAGVGKTALAVHWSHQVAGRFPDGQLYVNLRGYDPGQPVTAPAALAGFLGALGVPGQDIPAEADERAARYRSLLAGKRMLVVLDNAGDVEQVRPLLPGSPACVVVVTSRDALAGLIARDGAHRLNLDLLTEADAVGLLRALIGGRVDADPAAAAALAAQCCRLPLALRVAAELAAARPAVALAGLAGELADLQHRLDLLDVAGDPRTAVRVVFSWSYRHLDADAARGFRLLGLHPGADADAYATAALVGWTVERARRMLSQLAGAHLVQPAGHDRYGLHDLLRAYARELAGSHDTEGERRAALTRLFDYYLHAAATAMDTLHPAESHNRPRIPVSATPAPPLAGPAAARAWLDTELATLVVMAAYMAEHGWPGHATRLAATLSLYLVVSGHYPEAVPMYTSARNAARRTGDRAAEARALIGFGLVDLRQGRCPQATGHFQQALALCREAGDRAGEARALGNLGLAEFQQGRFQEATGHLEQVLALSRETGNQTDIARWLTNLGFVALNLGRFQEATGRLEQAAVLYRETRDPIGEAHALCNLGDAHFRLGHCQEAIGHLRQALAIFRETGGRTGEADTLCVLGDIDLREGRRDQASDHQQQALAIFRETGSRPGEAKALNGLGEALRATGRSGAARAMHTAALALAAQVGDQDQQGRARDGLARYDQATAVNTASPPGVSGRE